MNIVEAFKDYIVANVTALGQDVVKISRATSGVNGPDRLWWLIASGGGQSDKTIDGKITKTAVIDVLLRDKNAQNVYDSLEAFSDEISCSNCNVSLEGYNVINIEVSGQFTDNDLDNEERTVGLVQVTLTIYKEC